LKKVVLPVNGFVFSRDFVRALSFNSKALLVKMGKNRKTEKLKKAKKQKSKKTKKQKSKKQKAKKQKAKSRNILLLVFVN
jgi:mannitol-specific phosphotransferase system IIBC component